MLKIFPFFLPARQLYTTQKMFVSYYSIRHYCTIKNGLVNSYFLTDYERKMTQPCSDCQVLAKLRLMNQPGTGK